MEADASYCLEDCFTTTKNKSPLRLNRHKDKKCNCKFQEEQKYIDWTGKF